MLPASVAVEKADTGQCTAGGRARSGYHSVTATYHALSLFVDHAPLPMSEITPRSGAGALYARQFDACMTRPSATT